jgi:hypothetical protein
LLVEEYLLVEEWLLVVEIKARKKYRRCPSFGINYFRALSML